MSLTSPTHKKRYIIESPIPYTNIDESANIHGVALLPRISRNNNLYTKQELQRFNDVKVPLNWEHDPSKVIGMATFHYNSEIETVFYDGEITDEAAASLARNKTLFTSIEAEPTSAREICNGASDCFSMPFGLVPKGLALTETPGVPETTVIVERFLNECQMDKDLEKKYAPHQQQEVGTGDIVNKLANDCISNKISVLSKENPDMSQDQKTAIAIDMCAGKEAVLHMMNPKVREYFCESCGELKTNN